MGSRGKPIFDLNEPPAEDEEENNSFFCFQPQPAVPSSSAHTSDAFTASSSSQILVNNHAFSHASSVSGFQPFIRSKGAQAAETGDDQNNLGDTNFSSVSSKSNNGDDKTASQLVLESVDDQVVEDKESFGDRSRMVNERSISGGKKDVEIKPMADMVIHGDSGPVIEKVSGSTADNIKEGCSNTASVALDTDLNDVKHIQIVETNCKPDNSTNCQEEPASVPKQREIKGAESIHALKLANNSGKRPKVDQHKEAMLGKKRSRQTMFLNLEDVKQAGAIKSSTPRRQNFTPSTTTRTVKEIRPPSLVSAPPTGEKLNKDTKQVNLSYNEGSSLGESNDPKSEGDGDMTSGAAITRSRRLNSTTDLSAEAQMSTIPRQGPWKTPTDLRQNKNSQGTSKKLTASNQSFVDTKAVAKKLPSKKQNTSSVTQYLDTSVERLLREVTNEKFWHHPEEAELQCVPGQFESVEEYVRVFEPLLFEECRAQLYSTWEELTETVSRDLHVMVRVKSVERRERGNVFKSDDDHILRKLHPKGIWYLTVLGTTATTQREYIALHAFRRLNLQMQTAILHPSPEHFPKYEEQQPVMPECFTPNFSDYLRKTFNEPQLAAIQWAAMHTAAGTTNAMAKRQDPWPFTLVQGPPGTGKTHTVWGMLNVIHLIQYQHYYTALLKKLAPESYKQTNESNSENVATGSIDEVLQSMDQNLFRTLPKLCPKPRMLVCAPSNAATDELLSRVLDRGFIDGEMKIYRPDVARVGVDSQTRAAQAVSVERRTEQLLVKNRDEVFGWMHQLRAREAMLSQQIGNLQMSLNAAAVAGRAQGSIMGNANALIKSEDWAALINDAKARNNYMDMDALPKDFLAPKAPAYAPLPVKSARGFRSGPRQRPYDMHMESRSGTPSEDDEKSNSTLISRNGSYRSFKPHSENSLDDFDQSGDKSRDAWQHGVQKKQNYAGIMGKRDL
uniref:DNA2/NAM7 helicase helicase domain-containing protein n=1 Tax=Daucus carota subsp. sativus TaxID=79200 RepID=A0A166G3A3_DAUCS